MKQLLFTAALVSCLNPALGDDKYKDLAPGQPAVNQINAGELDTNGWCRAHSTFGNFEVDLPGKYVDTMLKIKGRTGLMVMHQLMTKLPIGGQIGVSFMELRGEPKLDGDAFESMVKQNKDRGTFAGRATVDIAGRKADHLSIKSEGVLGEVYRIKTDGGDYLIILQYPKKHAAQLRTANKRILATFKIKKVEPPKKAAAN